MIFTGVCWVFVAAFLIYSVITGQGSDWLERKFGIGPSLWIIWGGIGSVFIVAYILFDYISNRLAMTLGIIGWIITVSSLLWFYWFGPGAFGHHHHF